MKLTNQVNWRVEVHPYKWIGEGKEIDCHSIVDQIKRHVDHIGNVNVISDTEVKCSHCGYDWEEDTTGEPMCCNIAQDEWRQEAGGKTP